MVKQCKDEEEEILSDTLAVNNLNPVKFIHVPVTLLDDNRDLLALIYLK